MAVPNRPPSPIEIWPQPPGVPLTALAKRYSHPFATERPNGKVKGFESVNYQIPWKSGLTPLIPPSPSDQAAFREFLLLESYQIKQHGFHTAELKEMGALGYFDAGILNASLHNIPIHPILAKHKWEHPFPRHLAKYPLGLGRQGFWETQNPVVWDAMQPAIRLASQIIWNVHTWPWWAAFLDPNQYSRIDNADIEIQDQGLNLLRFKSPSPWAADDPQWQRFVYDKLLALGDKIDFKLYSGLTNPSDGMAEPKGNYGETEAQRPFRPLNAITIWISFEMINPLLDPNIGIGDRLLSHHLLATTLVHELTHALCAEMRPEHPGYILEPYFEQEPDAEVGHSLENAVFGGGQEYLTTNYPANGLALAGITRFNWPTSTGARDPRCPTLVNKGSGFNKVCRYPIRLKYFEEINTGEFWQTYVKKYGPESTHMGPRTKGAIEDLPDSLSSSDSSITSGSNSSVDDIDFPDPFSVGLSLALTADEARARQIAAARRTYADNFRQALRRLDAEYNARRQQGVHIPRPTRLPDNYVRPEFRPTISESRYDRIKLYLFMNLRNLALTTHWFSMPEHLMLKYIQNSHFVITASEWRAFILMCERKNELYNNTTIGHPPAQVHKFITRNPNGWPPATLKIDLQLSLPANPGRIARVFELVSPILYHGEWILNDDPEATEHLYDYDIYDFLKLFNIELSKQKLRKEDKLPFSMADLLWVINWWEINRPGQRVTFGPFNTGIIRLYGNGWPAMVPTPPWNPNPVPGFSISNQNSQPGFLPPFPPNMAAGQFPSNTNIAGGFLPPFPPNMAGGLPPPNSNPTGGFLPPFPPNMAGGPSPMNQLPPPNQSMAGGFPSMNQFLPSNPNSLGTFAPPSTSLFTDQPLPNIGGVLNAPGGLPNMNQFLSSTPLPRSRFATSGQFNQNTPGNFNQNVQSGLNQNTASGSFAQNLNMGFPSSNQNPGSNQNPFSNTPRGPSGFSP